MRLRVRLIRAGLVAWAVLTVMLGISLFLERRMNAPLRERIVLLERLDALALQYCEGVERVNAVCESQFIDVLQRLGLDNEMMPLVTTALWKRATGGFRVSEARKIMGAKKYASGFLERSQLDHEAIGGPSEDDESGSAPLVHKPKKEKPK